MTDTELAIPDGIADSFLTIRPADVLALAQEQAKALRTIIENNRLYLQIGDRRHVYVEGWTTLGALRGIYPVVEWSRELRDPEDRVLGWEARVTLQDREGRIYGAAEAECRKTEPNWRNRDSFAIRSMAQTRAVGSAFRKSFSWVMALSGYEATPADEVDSMADAKRRVQHTNSAKSRVLELVGEDKTRAKELYAQALDEIFGENWPDNLNLAEANAVVSVARLLNEDVIDVEEVEAASEDD